MQIKFHKVWIRGFRSIVDPQEFILDRPGLNLIKGTNGKGKSTLFESLVWCLYGKNLKDTANSKVQSWKELRGDDWSGTKVIVHLTVDGVHYTIERNEPGDLIVEKNLGRIPELDKKDTQAYIDDLLTMDFKTFMNSFMFGQRMTRMVESTAADKRKLFEELFDMDWIQGMRDKAVEDRAAKEREITNKTGDRDKKSISVGFFEDDVAEAVGRLEEQKAQESLAKEQLEREIHDLHEEKKKHDEQQSEWSGILSRMAAPVEVKDYTDDITRLEGTLSSEEQEVSRYERELAAHEAKHDSYEEQLTNFDSSNYNNYLTNVAKVEAEMKDIVSTLYPDDPLVDNTLLSEEEQMAIQHEYEDSLAVFNDAQSTLNGLQRQAVDSGQTECAACKRPFDNADEIEKHKKHIEDEIVKQKKVLATTKAILEDDRKAANLLSDYVKLEGVLKAMNDNAPRDPEEQRKQLKSNMDIAKIRIDQLKSALSTQNERADKVEADLQEFEKLQEASKEQIEENRELNGRRNQLERDIKDSHTAMDACDTEVGKLQATLLDSKLPKLETELHTKQDKLKTAQQDLLKLGKELTKLEEELEVINFWVKDVFAANGMKAYIFKAMLDQLNNHTAKYGAKLGCSIRFSLDLTKVSAPFSTICTIGDKVGKQYGEFSGGQKQRLDIVLLLAMHDLLSATTDINVLILDEVFESLDEQGISDVLDILSDKQPGKSIYVITHSAVIDVMHSKTIDIGCIDGKTIIDYKP